MKYVLVGPVLRMLFRIRVVGRENIPRRNGVLLAANHLTNWDSLLIALVAPRQIAFGARSNLFEGTSPIGKLVTYVVVRTGQLAVDRSGGAAGGFLELAASRIRGGGVVGIHPEGTLSPDGRLYGFKTGAARIALQTGATIVPIGLSFSPWRWYGRRVTVQFGGPVTERDYAGHMAISLTRLIEADIQAMTHQEQAGTFASLPTKK